MTKVLHSTKFLQLKSTVAKSGHDWVYAHRPNAKDVVIILPTTEDEVLFIIEERPPIQAENIAKYTIGLAAGLVGDERIGETIEEAIHAELLEETGLVADRIDIKSRKVTSSAGCVSEVCTIAIAYIKNKAITKPPISDGGVLVDRIWIKKSEIKDWLKQKENEGYALTAHSLAALFYLE
jgi:8-oxo-dGTP pyrophosphatase MutT (NUDIX family)